MTGITVPAGRDHSVSFAALGTYLPFQMVVLAALRAQLRGWRPAGPFTLGHWGFAVNVAALLYGVAAIVNRAAPVPAQPGDRRRRNAYTTGQVR